MSIAAIIAAKSSYNAAGLDAKHPTAKKTGVALAATAVVGGILAVYGLSIAGFLGKGPFAGMSLKGKIAVLATVGGLDALTVLGIALKKCGFGASKTAVGTEGAANARRPDDSNVEG